MHKLTGGNPLKKEAKINRTNYRKLSGGSGSILKCDLCTRNKGRINKQTEFLNGFQTLLESVKKEDLWST